MKAGIVLVDKPEGMSSAEVVRKVKRLFHPLPVGHAGTLDPFATGLLICLVGRATKLAHYAQFGQKTYEGAITFGMATDTDDVTGEVVSNGHQLPSFLACREALPKFLGVISQVPPNISAVKVQGKRAYKLARAGEKVSLTPREVEIFSFSFGEKLQDEEQVSSLTFRISCSKGTYIRSIARDIGKEVGSAACLQSLRRTESIPFSVDNAVRLPDLERSSLVSWDILFPHASRLSVTSEQEHALAGGDQRVLPGLLAGAKHCSSELVIYCRESSGEPLGILVPSESGSLKLGVHVADSHDERESQVSTVFSGCQEPNVTNGNSRHSF
jgi:tRNA pseudouridine(55) synthase